MSVNLATMERLNSDLRLARENRMRAVERRDELYERQSTGNAGDSEDDSVRLEQLRRELSRLTERFSDNHPTVRRARAQIEALERTQEPHDGHGENESVLERQIREIDEYIAELREEERGISERIERYEESVNIAPRVEHELAGLRRQYEAAREQHATLLERYHRIQMAEAHDQRAGTQIRIAESPVLPDAPHAPNRMGLLFMGLLMSLVVAGGVTAILEQFDTSFHTLSELQTYTGIPVAAAIPRIVTRSSIIHSSIKFIAMLAILVGVVVVVAWIGLKLGEGNTQLVLMLAGRDV
jgi:uncharacterized protein involved in exopolysaccharide biosynthesis